jgi:hypothetical protein
MGDEELGATESELEGQMAEFKPDERQQRLIAQALRSHRKAQARGQCAPERLVEKWGSEVGIKREKKDADTFVEENSQDARSQNSRQK